MNGNIKLTAIKTDCCNECGKQGSGVQFYILDDKQTDSFLCWEHFRLNTDILMEAGILCRHTIVPRSLLPEGSWTESVGAGWSHSEGESVNQGVGMSYTETQSESRSETQ